jgi:ribonuclease HI
MDRGMRPNLGWEKIWNVSVPSKVKNISDVAAWYIWWQLREAVKGERVAPAATSAFSIHALTENYGASKPKALPREDRCPKPLPGQYKLNVDACFFPSGQGAAVAIIRNHMGEAVVGGACPLSNIIDASTTEAMALRFGLQIIDENGCSPSTIESDSLEPINSCNGVNDMWSPYTAILADCFQLAHRIGNISFKHCPRNANKAAHNLARFSYDSNSVIR